MLQHHLVSFDAKIPVESAAIFLYPSPTIFVIASRFRYRGADGVCGSSVAKTAFHLQVRCSPSSARKSPVLSRIRNHFGIPNQSHDESIDHLQKLVPQDGVYSPSCRTTR